MVHFSVRALRFKNCPSQAKVMLVVFLLLTACNTQQEVPKELPGELTESSQPHSDITPAIQNATSTKKESGSSSRQGVDTQENWETEEVNSAVGRQLHVIGDFITEQNQVNRTQLVGVASSDYHSTPLRPLPLEIVFEDSAFTVRRPARSIAPAKQFSGTSGLSEALLEIKNWLGKTTRRHHKFKTFRVVLKGDYATTTSVLQLSGTLDKQSIQQKSTWTCRWHRQKLVDPRLLSIKVTDYEETFGSIPQTGPMFADCTFSALEENKSYKKHLLRGVDYWLGRIEKRFGISPSGLSGITLGDVNGDGLEDMFIAQPGGLPNLLFVQRQDGTFEDKSEESGLNWWDHTESALLLDLDNDGDQDLVTTSLIGVILFENNGTGRFKSKQVYLSPEGSPYCFASADYDNDGDLDIFVGCFRTYLKHGEMSGTSSFMNGLERIPNPYHDANNGARNLLLENLGNWTFRDASKKVGLNENSRRFTQACSWEDFDNDGDVDLYLANDFGRNCLYRNDDGKFTDIAAEAGVEDLSAGMSVSWGDYNNDGWMDLYVSNMFSAAGGRIAFQRRFLADADTAERSGFQRHARGNSLFRNSGDGHFTDVSDQAGVTLGRWAWSSQFVDLNNDTWEDLVVVNGHLTRDDTGDL